MLLMAAPGFNFSAGYETLLSRKNTSLDVKFRRNFPQSTLFETRIAPSPSELSIFSENELLSDLLSLHKPSGLSLHPDPAFFSSQLHVRRFIDLAAQEIRARQYTNCSIQGIVAIFQYADIQRKTNMHS